MDQRVLIGLGLLIRENEHGPEVLIAQRRKDQVLGGFWEFPGGKIEPQETVAAGIEREFVEEVGLVVHAHESLPTVVHAYEHAVVELSPWICRWVQGVPSARQADQLRWARIHALDGVNFPAANAPIVAELIRRVDGG